MANGTILDALDKVKEGIKVGFESGDPFANLSYNWDEKTRDLPRVARNFDRSEPLQFPNLAPPARYTHCHGRFIQNQHQSSPTWVDYPYDEGRMLVLPPMCLGNRLTGWDAHFPTALGLTASSR